MREQVESLIRDVLMPLFEADGASLELVAVEGKSVRVRFGGSYRGCPSAPYTLDGVVIPALRARLGTDVQVELVP